MKKNIAVLFGGKSSEHDISVLTGFQVVNNLDKNKYRIFPIYITQQNEWFLIKKIEDVNKIKNKISKNKFLRKISFCDENAGLYAKNVLKSYKFMQKIDSCIVALHGMNGEDGVVQGLLEMHNVPYSSCELCSSAICLDKVFTKIILKYFGYEQAEFLVCKKKEYENFSLKFDFPVVVKPARLGSSIGISFCKNNEEFFNAMKLAFMFDNKVIIEKAVENLVEYNCAVTTFCGKILASEIEQPIKSESILSFSDKYLNSSSGKNQKGMKNLSRIIPAKISRSLQNKITELSKKLYEDFECSGVVRIDFMFDSITKKLYVNEINTIPGSMAFYLFKNKGISFSQLLDGLIVESFEKANKKDKLLTDVKTGITF